MNRNLSALFLCLLITSFTAFGQRTAELDVRNVSKVTILNPGLSYEFRIAKFQTIYTQAFMNLSATFDYSDALGYQDEFFFDPALTAQYRYYYNGRRRADMGRRTEMNSMNYVAGVAEMIFTKMPLTGNFYDETSRRSLTRFGAVWGFQRNYKSRFSLDLNLGLGYAFASGTQLDYNNQVSKGTFGQPTFLGQINIGIWLSKRNAGSE